MTFSVLKTYPVFADSFFAPLFCFNKFLSSFIKLCFRIFNPLLLHPSRCTPSIEPQPAKFLQTVCQRFCQPSESCSDPCFSFCTTDNGERGWGGGRGVKCERVGSVFNHEFTPIGPLPNLYFLTHYTATKNSFTLLEITIGQDKICPTLLHQNPSPTDSCSKGVAGGGAGEGSRGGHCFAERLWNFLLARTNKIREIERNL
jgi:hypothetical protein